MIGVTIDAIAVGDSAQITRRVTDGASKASPCATARMPATSCSGGTSLSRNPLAPALRAS